MTRQQPKHRGRVTEPVSAAEIDNSIPPLRSRRPLMFWAVVVAAAAMVLSTVGAFLQLL